MIASRLQSSKGGEVEDSSIDCNGVVQIPVGPSLRSAFFGWCCAKESFLGVRYIMAKD